MAIKEQTIEAIALKKLNGVAHTGSQFGLANESKGTGFSLKASTIFANPVPSAVDDVKNVGLGVTDSTKVVEKIRLEAIAMAGTNNGSGFAQTYELKIPNDYAGVLGDKVRGKKLNDSAGRLQLIPSAFAPVDSSTGMSPYKARLYSGTPSAATLINDASDPREFIVDYYNGTIFLDNPTSANGAVQYVDAFIYVGKYLDENTGASTQTSHEYTELLSMALNGELEAGKQYMLTDYRYLVTDNNGTPILDNSGNIQVGLEEKLVLTAISSEKFSPNVTSMNLGDNETIDDIIIYDMFQTNWDKYDNQNRRFVNDELNHVEADGITPVKATLRGVITHRHSPKANVETAFDFRGRGLLNSHSQLSKGVNNIKIARKSMVDAIPVGFARNLVIGENVNLSLKNLNPDNNLSKNKISHIIESEMFGGKFSMNLDLRDGGITFTNKGAHLIGFLPPNSLVTNFKMACDGLGSSESNAMVGVYTFGDIDGVTTQLNLVDPALLSELNGQISVSTTITQNDDFTSGIFLDVTEELNTSTTPIIRIWGDYITFNK
jgi:hypothetical protein